MPQKPLPLATPAQDFGMRSGAIENPRWESVGSNEFPRYRFESLPNPTMATTVLGIQPANCIDSVPIIDRY